MIKFTTAWQAAQSPKGVPLVTKFQCNAESSEVKFVNGHFRKFFNFGQLNLSPLANSKLKSTVLALLVTALQHNQQI